MSHRLFNESPSETPTGHASNPGGAATGGATGWLSRFFWGTGSNTGPNPLSRIQSLDSQLKGDSDRGSTQFLNSANAGVRTTNAEYQERDQKLLSTIRSRAPVDLSISRENLDRLSIVLYKAMERGLHRRRVHAYEDTFWGKSAVDYLVATQIVNDAGDARNVLRNLLKRHVILRMDHTRPFFNSTLSRVFPKLAESRETTLRIKHQVTETDFRDECLYAFNPSAFCTEHLVVTVVGASGLRYKSRLSFGPFVMSAKFRDQKLDAYAQLVFQGQEVQTSIVHSNANPVWDEEFSLLISFDQSRKNSDLWIRVFDFHEVLDDHELGIAVLTMETIRRKCANGKRWRSKHLLLPSSQLDSRREKAHGEIELEIEIRSYFANDPDATVFAVARETIEQRRARLGDEESTESRTSAGGATALPPTGGNDGPGGTITDHTLNAVGKITKGVGNFVTPRAVPTGDGVKFDLVLESSKIHAPGERDLHMRDRFFWAEYKVGNHRANSAETTVSVEAFKDMDVLHDLGPATIRRMTITQMNSLRLVVVIYMRTYDFVKVRLADGSIPLRRFLEREETSTTDKEKTRSVEKPPLMITLRRPAAFKRDVKKKVGMLYLSGHMERGDEGSESEHDRLQENEGNNSNDTRLQVETLDVEPSLAALRDAFTGDDTASFIMPDPLKYSICNEKVHCGMTRLTVLLMSAKSPVLQQFAKQMGYTEFTVGEWMFSKAATAAVVPAGNGDGDGIPHDDAIEGGEIHHDTNADADLMSPRNTQTPGTTKQANDVQQPTLSTTLSNSTPSSAADPEVKSDGGQSLTNNSNSAKGKNKITQFFTRSSRGGGNATVEQPSPSTIAPKSPSPPYLIRQESLKFAEQGGNTSTRFASASALEDEHSSASGDVTPTLSLQDPPRRVVTFVMPASAVVKSLKVSEVHEVVSWVPNVGLVLLIVGEAPDAPYGSTFKNAIQIVVTSQGRDHCMVSISSETRFLTKPFGVVSMIESGSAKGAKEAYNTLVRVLQGFVKAKKKAIGVSPEAPQVEEVEEEPAWFMLRMVKKGTAMVRRHSHVTAALVIVLLIGFLFAIVVLGVRNEHTSLTMMNVWHRIHGT